MIIRFAGLIWFGLVGYFSYLLTGSHFFSAVPTSSHFFVYYATFAGALLGFIFSPRFIRTSTDEKLLTRAMLVRSSLYGAGGSIAAMLIFILLLFLDLNHRANNTTFFETFILTMVVFIYGIIFVGMLLIPIGIVSGIIFYLGSRFLYKYFTNQNKPRLK